MAATSEARVEFAIHLQPEQPHLDEGLVRILQIADEDVRGASWHRGEIQDLGNIGARDRRERKDPQAFRAESRVRQPLG